MFVQGCMQENEPRLHRYMGQDHHSHTTGTFSHRPERDKALTNFPRIALMASLNIETIQCSPEKAKQQKLSESQDL